MDLGEQISEQDLSVLLTYLARDKSIIAYSNDVVKFKSCEESSVSISDNDRAIASLKALISDLDQQVTLLTTKIADCSQRAKEAVGRKNKTLATVTLRSKKMAERTLAQRAETLTQLEGVYAQIEQAADQVAMVKVMQGSTKVLRSLRAETGGSERVEAIVDELRDEMGHVEEVSSIIERAGQGSVEIDEDVVDEELEAMLQQARQDDEERATRRLEERLATIPVIDSKSEISQDPVNASSKESAPEPSIQRRGSSPTEKMPSLSRLSLDDGKRATATIVKERTTTEAPSGQ